MAAAARGVMKASEPLPAASDQGSNEGSVLEPVSTSAVLVLLASFVGLLDVGEHDRAAQLWDLPALILGDTHVHGPMSLERLATWLRSIEDRADEPPSYGMPDGKAPTADGAPLIRNVEWTSRRVAVVDTRWPSRPRGGLLAGVEGSTFLIRIDQSGQAKIRGLLLRASALPSDDAS
jgi:hypothetical protein